MSARLFELLLPEQLEKLETWVFDHNLSNTYSGAIGGRYTFSFTPTSLGLITKVRDNISEQEIDLTDYENW